ncbi:MAG: site-specific DNA-methyltransferase [Alphaproteobacteria bacterium]
MANIEKQRERLIVLLKELFQLDQPDLDFGFYRIMHAKAGQVSKFLEEDLLGIIREAFGEADDARIAEARAAYEAAKKQAEEFGAPDPDAAPKVKEVKVAWDVAKDSGSNEGDVYDHLYRFFERYYDNGDFMSRRYFARETDGKAAPYAVPYDGREVYLHWANRDQYYIKTSEYLSNFTFDPTQATEFKAHHGELFDDKPIKVHCRVVEASEGEHNNVKATEQTERYFIIHDPEPVKLETGGTGAPELVMQFEYRPDAEKTGQEGTWRKKRLLEAAEKVKGLLPSLDGGGDYVTALMTPAPTEAEKDRTLLEKYLAQYTARNTMDYFIHKDLGGFLRRELDFYIKNEIIRLDDIDSADAPRVESYLAKVKVLRRIAQHLIDFLAQLENFQKKLWLKKKFVVDTQYCITLDRIPEEFYPEIAANDAQRREWVRLFAIDDLSDYSSTLNAAFLKANTSLTVDTALFGNDFRDRVISALEDIENETKGVLAHSENFQAVRLFEAKYRKSASAIYIDPPYNAKSSEIAYKNTYKHSSWLSFMQDRIHSGASLLRDDGVHAVAIDEVEQEVLSIILDQVLNDMKTVVLPIVSNPRGQQGKNVSAVHEYMILSYPSDAKKYLADTPKNEVDSRTLRDSGTESDRTDAKTCFYPFIVRNGEIVEIGQVPPDDFHPTGANVVLPNGDIEVWPLTDGGDEKKWRYGWDTVPQILEKLEPKSGRNSIQIIFHKDTGTMRSLWVGAQYDASEYGTKVLQKMLGEELAKEFSYPKSINTVREALEVQLNGQSNGLVVDYFAGSGTTGHAVIEINRKSEENDIRYVLVDMGSYFDVVLKPRIQKSIYSSDWDGGKPLSRNGVSQCIKYVRLETYEDALNNLAFRPAPSTAQASPDFARDYMLRYWLDFESKGSPSLLNIEWFDDPTAYKLKIKKPGTDEYVEKAVDLVETFNWLIGLHVEHLDRWRGYDAAFKREADPELPGDTNTRLILDGALKETDDGAWRIRKVEGYRLRTPGDQNDREKVLVIWRKLTDDLEQDNLVLDEWFKKCRLSTQDTEFDVIYVNGSNNLPNLRKDEETWKVRLIEEAFHQAMWDVEG